MDSLHHDIVALRKFTAEQHKLIAEASKFRVERWLAPVTAIAAAIGALIAAYSTVAALLHIAGH